MELGRAIGEFSRWAVDREPAELAADYDLDERAASNLVSYLREQREATRVVPSDRTIVIERFRDEIGDWRLCVLSPFGGRVHAAWGLALSARIRDQFGLESDAIWSDDGIVVHLPDADEPPGAELVLVEPDELEDLVVRELSSSALYGARFRENAARALLLPRAYPGKRTPLWQQRLKAQSLLEVAKRYGQFPIVLETYRECLRDVLDLPGLEELLRGLHTRELSLVEAETQRASPFASSLLFDYVATYMYEGDTPNAERRAAALSLDRDLLRELLGQEELRDLIDAGRAGRGGGRPPAPVRAHPGRHRRRAARRAARGGRPDLLRGGPARARRRGLRRAMLRTLEAERRAVSMRIGGEERWIAAEDAGLYRDALGAVPPGGLPAAFLDESRRPLRAHPAPLRPHPRALHHARGGRPLRHRPHPGAARSWSPTAAWCAASCARAAREREWCDTDVLRRLRRASLAVLRKEVEPAEQQALARFLPAWQGVDSSPPGGAGVDRLREVLVPLQGVALAPEVWETDVLPRRAGAYSPAWIDQLCASGELVWVGAGLGGPHLGQGGAVLPRGRRLAGAAQREGRAARRARARGASASGWPPGACFWTDLLADLAFDPAELQEALWDLVWAGEVTNDAFAPLRAPKLSLAREQRQTAPPLLAPAPSRRPPGAGALVAHRAAVRRRARPRPADAGHIAEVMLERYGIVTRETVLAEGIAGRLLHPVRRAGQPGDAGHRPPRLLRRGAGRRAVRPARGHRAPARPARGRARRRAGAGRHRPGQPVRAPRCPGPSATTTAGPAACPAPTWSPWTPSPRCTWSAAARA